MPYQADRPAFEPMRDSPGKSPFAAASISSSARAT